MGNLLLVLLKNTEPAWGANQQRPLCWLLVTGNENKRE